MKYKEILSIAGLQYFSMGLNFLIQLYLTFLLAPEFFGVFAKLAAIKEIFGALLAINIPIAIIYTKEKDLNKLITTSFYLGIAQGIIYLLGGIILVLIAKFFWLFDGYELVILYILVFGIAVSSLQQVLFTFFEKLELFQFNSFIVIIVQLVTGIVVIVVSLLTKDLILLILRDVLPGLILIIVYLILTMRKWGLELFKLSAFDKTLSKEILVYSSKMYFSRTIESIFFKLDILFASAYFNTGAVGIYERIKYFATLPQTLITSVIVRVNLVKYSKNDNIDNVQRTNFVAMLVNVVAFIALYFVLYLLDKSFAKSFNEYLFPMYLFFFAYAGFGSIIENIKTYFYATNEVLKSAILLRLIPVLLFVSVWIIFNQFMSLNITYSALLLSASYILPLVLIDPNLYKVKNEFRY